MLASLQVHNYALIRRLEIDFHRGLTIITGETGAGKSILLGAMGLLLGKRADTSVLMDQSQKCVVEGQFSIADYGLEDFFRGLDVDYDDQTIVRREISPAGKSRAFINDTPVNLSQMSTLGTRLVDIHSQHQNLELGKHVFQLRVLDSVSGNAELLTDYKKQYGRYRELEASLESLRQQSRQAQTDLDYFRFQFSQLEEAALVGGEEETIETELQTLDHAEEIKQGLFQVHSLLNGEEQSVRDLVTQAVQALRGILPYYPAAGEWIKRMESAWIELKDLSESAEVGEEQVELDPKRQEYLRERLDLLNNLMHKHGVDRIAELISIRDELDLKIQDITSYDQQIAEMEEVLDKQRVQLEELTLKLSASRAEKGPVMEEQVIDLLGQLGIPQAGFQVNISRMEDFGPSGIDEVEFLFTANKQAPAQEISKVASGGEISRLMLSIKSLLSDSLELPTIIFDEVDAGVSGEIADKVGQIMRRMSGGKQVINITHLPQVAGQGNHHYLVYKFDEDGGTRTSIRALEGEDRVLEIAKMLSGEELTDAAISNARELLN